MRAVGFAGIGGADDVGMIEPTDRLHLPFEAADCVRVLHAVAGEDFEGDDLLEFGVEGLVDRAHAAVADFFE